MENLPQMIASAVNEQNNLLWQRLESHVQRQLVPNQQPLPIISVTCPQRQNTVWCSSCCCFLFVGAPLANKTRRLRQFFKKNMLFLNDSDVITTQSIAQFIHTSSLQYKTIFFSPSSLFLAYLQTSKCCMFLLMLFYFCIINNKNKKKWYSFWEYFNPYTQTNIAERSWFA